jgi:hypothetical protein
MLKAKEAVEKAQEHLLELFPELRDKDLQMEEIFPFGENWRITFSAAPPPVPEDSGNIAYLLQPRRIYKVVEVGAREGDFVSLRNPAA